MMRIGILAMMALALACVDVGAALVQAEESTPSTRRLPRGESRSGRQELLDELDEARINRDLLEMVVEADRKQIQTMLTVLRETELQEVQGFSRGPVLSGNTPEERETRLNRYKEQLEVTQLEFRSKSKQLGRERRRVAELENQLGLTTTAPTPTPTPTPAHTPATARGSERRPLSWNEAEQILALLRKGVESLQRGTGPERRPAPEDRLAPEPGARKETERFLDWIRKGIERWQGDSPREPEPAREPAPEPKPAPEPAPAPAPEARSAPEPAWEPSTLKDAERLLELILRGVESWQRR
jgi:hypothetical protein